MLNKKGTSIIELIVSIALLSIILAFMLKLLVDLNNVRTNTKFAKENQIIRSEIIRTIENDLKNNIITCITSRDVKVTDGGYEVDALELTFSYIEPSSSQSLASVLTIAPTELIYQYKKKETTQYVDKIRKWSMDSCKLYPNIVYVNYVEGLSSDTYGFVLNIQVHTANNENNEKRNNPLDDIQISYFNHENKPADLDINSCYSRSEYSC